MDPQTVLELLLQQEFLRGVAMGLVAAVALVLIPRLDWFLAWSLAALAAVFWIGKLGISVTVWWSLPAAGLVSLFAGIGAKELERSVPSWAVLLVFGLSVLGAWGTVPDTERAAALTGVTVGGLAVLIVRRRVPIGWIGAILAVGVLGGVIVTDGSSRGGAIVGALGTVGMLVVAPGIVTIEGARSRFPVLWLLACQILHVFLSGRVAGRMQDPLAAFLMVLVSAVLVGGLLWGGTRYSAERRGPVS
ncbi:MAG: hypothetical protein R3199_07890 [Gemmatimonadota bacterium]|nr:hypothetical protein [Gemmatimonadota bacterium]